MRLMRVLEIINCLHYEEDLMRYLIKKKLSSDSTLGSSLERFFHHPNESVLLASFFPHNVITIHRREKPTTKITEYIM